MPKITILLGRAIGGKFVLSKLNWNVTILGKSGVDSVLENKEMIPWGVIILFVNIIIVGPLDWKTLKSIKVVLVIRPLVLKVSIHPYTTFPGLKIAAGKVCPGSWYVYIEAVRSTVSIRVGQKLEVWISKIIEMNELEALRAELQLRVPGMQPKVKLTPYSPKHKLLYKFKKIPSNLQMEGKSGYKSIFQICLHNVQLVEFPGHLEAPESNKIVGITWLFWRPKITAVA